MKSGNIFYTAIVLMGMQFLFLVASAQEKTQPLPPQLYNTMRDSTDYIDVVFLQGSGGSLSIDVAKSVRFFNTFFDNKPAVKTNAPPTGTIMWLIKGREFISGNYFTGDSIGYVVLQKDGKEFVNQINEQGNTFFKSKIK